MPPGHSLLILAFGAKFIALRTNPRPDFPLYFLVGGWLANNPKP